jgi:hypothetical protein
MPHPLSRMLWWLRRILWWLEEKVVWPVADAVRGGRTGPASLDTVDEKAPGARVSESTGQQAVAPLICLGATVAASGAVLLSLESHLTFHGDEWAFLLDRRGWGIGDFFDPHVDHIALAPVSIYKLLVSIFGMGSPAPFQVTSTLFFLLSVVLLFVYLRRRVGDWLALLGSALILFLGASWIDLLWPFQIGFSGSIAAGLGALLALERDDPVGDGIACALLVVSMAFSEIGVPFAAGVLVSILVSGRPRIGRLYVVCVPLALYAIWWLGWGHTAESRFTLHNVLVSPKFVFDAASQAAASLVGVATPLHASEHDPSASYRDPVGLDWGRALLVAGIGLGAWRFRRLGSVPRTFWVALAMGASFWFLTAFNATPELFRTPTSSRYQYPGAVFLLLIAAELLRGVRPNRRALAVGSAVTALAVFSGLWFLHLGYAKRLKPQSDQVRAQLAAVEIARDRLQPGLVVHTATTMIAARSYLSAADAEGSPAYSESELASSAEAARFGADETLVAALGIQLADGQGSPAGGRGTGATPCQTVSATPTGYPGVSLGPGKVALRPQPGVSAEVLLARFADEFQVSPGPVGPGHGGGLTIPPDRSRHPWRLGLRGTGRVSVCERRAFPAPTGVKGGGAPPTPGGAPPTPGVFVGNVEGTEASIALVTDGQRLTGAYLCIPHGGTSWISPGPLVDGKSELVARRRVSLGEASFAGDQATGEVTVGGAPRSFSAGLAAGKAGLYHTTSGTADEPGSTETGWIVLPDGSVCGTTNSIIAGGGFKSEPAPSKPKGKVTNFANPFSSGPRR